MTFTISKTKLALAVVAVALIIPSTAMAFHVFDDVPDDKFYADPVEWAFDNGITTGKTSSTFAPDDGVTRGEAVTFLKRYNDNIVEPTTVNLFASDEVFNHNANSTAIFEDLGLTATVTVPEGHTAVIETALAAESACSGGDGAGDWCQVEIRINGTAIDSADDAFDSTDGGSETSSSWEGHSMIRVSDEVSGGTYAITAAFRSRDGSSTFNLDDVVLTAEVHLTS